jgi:beta-glucosidase
VTEVSFPKGFIWGTATAAYQIEGAVGEDGRGESIWDRFSHTPGKVFNGDSGDVACDHYHRFKDDIALMRELGVQAYRFSIAWPRIFPNGRGQINQAGLDFYQRLTEELLTNGITPMATLYHWDLPQALQEAGGWANRETAQAFAEYADRASRTLGDRIKTWITINEPWCVSFLSHQIGLHAPGLKNWTTAIAASHHVLLAHGLALPALRTHCPDGEHGITLNFTAAVPASRSAADLEAARRFDGYFNRWFLDPLYGRHYPADMVATYAAEGHLPQGMAFVQDGDLAVISAPTDFLGANYYTREVLRAETADNLPPTVVAAGADQRTDIGWEIYPEGLYQLLLRVSSDYDIPKIYITENGVSYGDGPDAHGVVNDTRRVDYLQQHFAAAQRAIAAGVPLKGYFVWSLMDNFEWAEGYKQRFGIVYVDYATQQRIPKASAHWYSRVIAANALVE